MANPNPSSGPTHAAAIQRGKQLTALLQVELAKCHEELDENGEAMTKAQAIIQNIVRDATGWTEKTRDEHGILREIKHPSAAWAKQWVVERTDGKAPNAMPDTEGGIRAKDKVRELVKDRLNAMVKAPAGPPVHKPKA